jgi:hypothetical protein
MTRTSLPRTLELVRGAALLGTIDVKPGDGDFPWHSGAFHPAPGFEAVRGLFALELRMLRENSGDDEAQWEEWEDVHAELHGPGLRLQGVEDDYAQEEILIHIDGTEAWWRGE